MSSLHRQWHWCPIDDSSRYGITAEGIRLDLTDNKQKGERPQWEFSAYAPGVGAPRQLLEGQVEQSEEEMRVMCYLAKATGQLQAYVSVLQLPSLARHSADITRRINMSTD